MLPSQAEFLRHILDECNYLIKEYQANTFEDLMRDERLTKAVCRSLEIIGEASNKIEPDLKARYPYVPWREMSDIRNKIIHDYFGIDYDIIWDAIKTDIPQVKEWLDVIIKQEEK